MVRTCFNKSYSMLNNHKQLNVNLAVSVTNVQPALAFIRVGLERPEESSLLL